LLLKGFFAPVQLKQQKKSQCVYYNFSMVDVSGKIES